MRAEEVARVERGHRGEAEVSREDLAEAFHRVVHPQRHRRIERLLPAGSQPTSFKEGGHLAGRHTHCSTAQAANDIVLGDVFVVGSMQPAVFAKRFLEALALVLLVLDRCLQHVELLLLLPQLLLNHAHSPRFLLILELHPLQPLRLDGKIRRNTRASLPLGLELALQASHRPVLVAERSLQLLVRLSCLLKIRLQPIGPHLLQAEVSLQVGSPSLLLAER
mmetsp:Transcript_28106/g.70530  ORF Transcript_28106/g.70530 Transcript_28106/m.70530 type:complete len:221 (-) Transcript_28106:3302-3964(-)